MMLDSRLISHASPSGVATGGARVAGLPPMLTPNNYFSGVSLNCKKLVLRNEILEYM